jgi:hypothetical protein
MSTASSLDAAVWTIPASRMKAGEQHRAPLSSAAIAVLKDMAAIRMSEYVFPGNAAGRPVHGASVAGLAKRVAGSDLTLHGFRSSFRDWCSERASFPHEVAEMALAHAIPSAVEKAYRRGDLFDKRRRLIEAWSEFCTKPNATAAVVPLRGARGIVTGDPDRLFEDLRANYEGGDKRALLQAILYAGNEAGPDQGKK